MEKSQAVYGMYRHILWKTFCFGKTAEMRRAARAAGKTFLQLPCPAGKLRFTEKILGAIIDNLRLERKTAEEILKYLEKSITAIFSKSHALGCAKIAFEIAKLRVALLSA